MADDRIDLMMEAQRRFVETKHALATQGYASYDQSRAGPSSSGVTTILPDQVYRALLNLSEPLARSYLQIRLDLIDGDRISWAGTAHEIREILRGILHILAPDAVVKEQPWYVQDRNTSGPTQKQKTRYILEQRRSGSKEQEVVQQVETIEEMVGNLVRGMYNRASDAAHGFKGHKEAQHLFRYFVAFAHDLLDLD